MQDRVTLAEKYTSFGYVELSEHNGEFRVYERVEPVYGGPIRSNSYSYATRDEAEGMYYATVRSHDEMERGCISMELNDFDADWEKSVDDLLSDAAERSEDANNDSAGKNDVEFGKE